MVGVLGEGLHDTVNADFAELLEGFGLGLRKSSLGAAEAEHGANFGVILNHRAGENNFLFWLRGLLGSFLFGSAHGLKEVFDLDLDLMDEVSRVVDDAASLHDGSEAAVVLLPSVE